MTHAESTFTATPAHVGAARRFVTATLEEWSADGFVWAATTVVSELATNALLHARSEFTVSLELDGDVLRIAVSDRSLRLPQQRRYDADATTGRGLHLLHELSSADGVDVTASGKTVWCELRATERSDGGQDLSADELASFAADPALRGLLAELDTGEDARDGSSERLQAAA